MENSIFKLKSNYFFLQQIKIIITIVKKANIKFLLCETELCYLKQDFSSNYENGKNSLNGDSIKNNQTNSSINSLDVSDQ